MRPDLRVQRRLQVSRRVKAGSDHVKPNRRRRQAATVEMRLEHAGSGEPPAFVVLQRRRPERAPRLKPRELLEPARAAPGIAHRAAEMTTAKFGNRARSAQRCPTVDAERERPFGQGRRNPDLSHAFGHSPDPNGAARHGRGQDFVVDVVASDDPQYRPCQGIGEARGVIQPQPARGRQALAPQPGLRPGRNPTCRGRLDIGEAREKRLPPRQRGAI